VKKALTVTFKGTRQQGRTGFAGGKKREIVRGEIKALKATGRQSRSGKHAVQVNGAVAVQGEEKRSWGTIKFVADRNLTKFRGLRQKLLDFMGKNEKKRDRRLSIKLLIPMPRVGRTVPNGDRQFHLRTQRKAVGEKRVPRKGVIQLLLSRSSRVKVEYHPQVRGTMGGGGSGSIWPIHLRKNRSLNE